MLTQNTKVGLIGGAIFKSEFCGRKHQDSALLGIWV